jgi:hypothetical protein
MILDPSADARLGGNVRVYLQAYSGRKYIEVTDKTLYIDTNKKIARVIDDNDRIKKITFHSSHIEFLDRDLKDEYE